MKYYFITKLLLSSIALLGGLFPTGHIAATLAQTVSSNKQAAKPSVQYRCIDREGTPATVAYTTRGPIELILWKSNYFSGSGYTPERRCQEVTYRFQQHSDAKNLRYISTGIVNRHKAICISEKSGNCKSNGLLITLQYDDNPEQVMRDLFDLATRQSSGGIYRPAIPGVAIKEIINVNKFLDESPVMEQKTTGSHTNSESYANPESPTTNNDSSEGTVIENPFDNF